MPHCHLTLSCPGTSRRAHSSIYKRKISPNFFRIGINPEKKSNGLRARTTRFFCNRVCCCDCMMLEENSRKRQAFPQMMQFCIKLPVSKRHSRSTILANWSFYTSHESLPRERHSHPCGNRVPNSRRVRRVV